MDVLGVEPDPELEAGVAELLEDPSDELPDDSLAPEELSLEDSFEPFEPFEPDLASELSVDGAGVVEVEDPRLSVL